MKGFINEVLGLSVKGVNASSAAVFDLQAKGHEAEVFTVYAAKSFITADGIRSPLTLPRIHFTDSRGLILSHRLPEWDGHGSS